jgi:RNA polymerase sigma-70 factor (ECF subfamily)
MTARLELVSDGHDGERELARLASSGDERAFERLYRAHAGRVFALCLRMSGTRQRATELTQDVFVQVWKRLATWRGESALSSWIYRLAVNLVLSNVRGEKRRQKHEVLEDHTTDMGQGTSDIGSAEARPASVPDAIDLERAIAALPPGARTVFVLHDVEGYQHNEIAAMTGTAEGTCRAQLHRARKLLMEALER